MQRNKYKEGANDEFYSETLSGKQFDYLSATIDDIDSRRYRRGAFNICRFSGHLLSFIAWRSIPYCAASVSPEFAFEALMHDAAEAYCEDILPH